MLILGIDPGSRYCGYGLLEIVNNRVVAAGCEIVNLVREKDLPQRLTMLYAELGKVIDQYKPDVAAVESMFFQKHIRSIFTLGHARGVILLAVAQRGIPMVEYSPREVKKAVVGNGNASKQQVRYMIDKMFKLTTKPVTDDAYDALGIAFCHHHRMRYEA